MEVHAKIQQNTSGSSRSPKLQKKSGSDVAKFIFPENENIKTSRLQILSITALCSS